MLANLTHFRGLLFSLSLLIVLDVGCCLSLEEDSCQNKDIGTVCQMPDTWDENTQCWVTCWTALDGGQRAAGERSLCKVKGGTGARYFKCQQGQWVSPEADIKHIKRQKRFLSRRRRSPPPPPPNYPPYFTYCPPSQTVMASSGLTSVVVTWTYPTAADPNGNSPSISLVSGQGPGSTFQEGATYILYRASDPGGLHVDCGFYVTVTVRSCPSAQATVSNDHRTQSCSGVRPHVVGSACSHACNAGYQLKGSKFVTCQSDGQWDHAFPTCTAVSCGDPGSVTGGQVHCAEGHVYPKSCALHCNSGFQLSGTSQVTCQSDSQWSDRFGQCNDIESPKFPSGCPSDHNVFSGPLETPVTVTWVDPVVTDNSGQPLTLRSDLQKGTSLNLGTYIVEVTAYDPAGNEASCRFKITVTARTCPSLSNPPNGHVVCTRRDVEGSECSVTCDLGYRLAGSSLLTCTGSSQWDNPMPTCDAIMCSPPTVQDGIFVCGSGHQHPAVCTLTCESGFSVQPPGDIRCQENATWTQLGSCLDYEPPEFVHGCPNDVNVFASRLGVDTRVTWSAPDVTDNSANPVTIRSDVISNSSFSLGVTRVTYVATDDTGNTNTCHFAVNVTNLYCKAPKDSLVYQDTPQVYDCPDNFVHGAACTVNCTHGYTLVGEKKIVCERDDRSFPPNMEWTWLNGDTGKPHCRVDKCPELTVPHNGALSCHLGSLGWDCLMTCQAGWDVPAFTRGHFYCMNSLQTWMPKKTVPECVVRLRPGSVRIQTSVFYLTESCNSSVDTLRHQFVSRMTNSIFKDACVHVPSCSAHNVKVTCGEVSQLRGRRAVARDGEMDSAVSSRVTARRLSRTARASGSTHYVTVTAQVLMPYEEDLITPESSYQKYQATHNLVVQTLKADAHRRGKVTDGHLTVVGPSSLLADCPAGTILRDDHARFGRFSCVGCGIGRYLDEQRKECREM